MNSEWYDTVSDNEIDSVSILKEMIEVREGMAKCDIFNIDDVEFIINDLCFRIKLVKKINFTTLL